VAKKWYNFFVVADRPADAEPGADATSSEAETASSRRVTDLIPGADGEGAITGPVPDGSALEAIYAAAQIPTPAHGYTILKVADMLDSEHIRELPVEVKRKSILLALDAAGVKVQEIVEDAVRRDRALDTYERVLEKSLADLRAAKEQENQRLEEEIDQRLRELRERIEQNKKAVMRDMEGLAAWRSGKRAEEARIAQAVGHFVTENPVTSGPDKIGHDKTGGDKR
jgi:Asp-tRNA(Asn)/Glu-tRNA(Gln) amidotransferase A subunit family amidase